jgi:hypothetical protein
MQVGSLISLKFHNKCIHRNFFVAALLKSPVMLVLGLRIMEEMKINKVSILSDGRLAIFPSKASSSYQYVYREASEVYWDNNNQYFYHQSQENGIIKSGMGISFLWFEQG